MQYPEIFRDYNSMVYMVHFILLSAILLYVSILKLIDIYSMAPLYFKDGQY